MATAPIDRAELDYREQLARIDKTQAEIVKIKVDTRFAPLTVGFAGLGAGAALFAAGAAFFKLMVG